MCVYLHNVLNGKKYKNILLPVWNNIVGLCNTGSFTAKLCFGNFLFIIRFVHPITKLYCSLNSKMPSIIHVYEVYCSPKCTLQKELYLYANLRLLKISASTLIPSNSSKYDSLITVNGIALFRYVYLLGDHNN